MRRHSEVTKAAHGKKVACLDFSAPKFLSGPTQAFQLISSLCIALLEGAISTWDGCGRHRGVQQQHSGALRCLKGNDLTLLRCLLPALMGPERRRGNEESSHQATFSTPLLSNFRKQV